MYHSVSRSLKVLLRQLHEEALASTPDPVIALDAADELFPVMVDLNERSLAAVAVATSGNPATSRGCRLDRNALKHPGNGKGYHDDDEENEFRLEGHFQPSGLPLEKRPQKEPRDRFRQFPRLVVRRCLKARPHLIAESLRETAPARSPRPLPLVSPSTLNKRRGNNTQLRVLPGG